MGNKNLLEVRNLSMQFGGLLAVDNVNLTVAPKSIVSVIGPNGAGKTTVFNCLTGFYTPTHGQVLFKGREIQKLPGYKVARLGMVRTFQHVRLFKDMTVLENLMVAQHQSFTSGFLAGLLNTKKHQADEKKALDYAAYWLEKINLLDLANRSAGSLAYGQQRRLEIARCMMTKPALLMLDEPAAGLNPKETDDLIAHIHDLRDHYSMTILLIEHDMKLVMQLSESIFVINQGALLASGTAEQVKNDPQVIKAYLGEE